jgi:hypothetical protein
MTKAAMHSEEKLTQLPGTLRRLRRSQSFQPQSAIKSYLA